MSPFFDLSRPRRVHVVGVGGPGMSAVALSLVDMGHLVSGSDVHENAVVRQLRSRGVRVDLGHKVSHVSDAEAVTYSTAIPADNIEVVEGRRRGLAVMHRAGMLAAICARARAIGVAGTHGKTTTSAMLLAILQAAGRDPSYVIGAEVLATQSGARWTGSDLMIVEADESDGTHAALPLAATIVTNIDLDHLDHFGSMHGLRDSFLEYASRISGPIVLCADNVETLSLAERLRGTDHADRTVSTYGVDPSADVVVSQVRESSSGTVFTVAKGAGATEKFSVDVVLPTFGMHNVMNATAALTMAHRLGVTPDVAAEALSTYAGVERRFQLRGVSRGSALIDDYAHLPAEIEAALAATRQRFPGKRVIAVFQPNRFHRIQAMASEYANCFVGADHVAITDVYASGTPRIEGVTGRLVVDAVSGAGGHPSVAWCATRDELVRHVSECLDAHSVCVSMGCGDIEQFPDELIAHDVREVGERG